MRFRRVRPSCVRSGYVGCTAAAALLLAAGLVAGCGAGPAETAVAGPVTLNGSVLGGQQGVAGATIKLYSAGKSGNGSAATSLLTVPVTTDRFGFFGITGDYSCANSSDQVYIVALGGNPGVGQNNAAIAMMAALGNCGDLLASGANRFIFMNEITTVAAAWALAPFMTGPANLGASSTNALGLGNAFLDAALLANTTTGNVAASSNGLTIEGGKVTALADALASCINSTGVACGPLFSAATPAGGTAPTDTITAALDIVKNPGHNVQAVWNTIPATPPFPTTLTQAPNDWTMTATIPLVQTSYQGYQLTGPTQVDIDATGTVWVAGFYGILNGVTPQGALLSTAGFGVGALNESYGLAIDTSGYLWVSNEESSPHAYGSVSKFQGGGMASPGAVIAGNGGTNFYDNSIDYPYDVTADASGHVFLPNYHSGAATEYSTSTNAPVATLLGAGSSAFPLAAAADGAGGVWLANSSSNTVTHALANGTSSNVNCCDGADGLATDAAGHVWVANYQGSSVSAVSFAGTVLVNQTTAGGITNPSRLAVDAGGTVWIANYHGSSISALSSGTVAGEPAIGTALSPSGGLGLDANLLEPYAAVPDRSGNLWVSNFYNDDLVMFFGLATPTKTPTMPVPVAP